MKPAPDEVGQCGLDGVEQAVLEQDVLERIARQRELRKTATATSSWQDRAIRSTDCALAAGSASTVRCVQAATRAKPCRYAEKKSTTHCGLCRSDGTRNTPDRPS